MWSLLVLLGLASCGTAQILFFPIKSVNYTNDNKTILIPCLSTNVEAKSIQEMFVKWKFGNSFFFYYDGYKNYSKPNAEFSTAYIVPEELLKGNASLIMDRSQAVPGNYTCEVTELTREGEIVIELKFDYRLQCYSCVNPVRPCTVIKNCEYDFDVCLYVKAEKRTLYQCWKFEKCTLNHLSKLIGKKSLHYKCCPKKLCNRSLRSSSGKSITGTITLLVILLLTAFRKLLI